MKTLAYDFLPGIFLRTPFYSFQDYGLARLPEILQRQDFKNALYLASPAFYGILKKKHFDFELLEEKEKFSLYKYYNRMCYRSIPFGSFASFTNLNWNNSQDIRLVNKQESILHLLPDQALRNQLLSYSKKNEADYALSLNPMCYAIGEELRFVHTTEDKKGHNNFTLDVIAAERLNIEIAALLKESPLSSLELTEWITENVGCSATEALDYIGFLIESQFLLTPYTGHIIEKTAQQVNASEPIQGEIGAINDFWAHWKSKSLEGVGQVAVASEVLGNIINRMAIKTGSQHFYSAIERPVADGALNCEYQNKLKNAIKLLERIAVSFNPPNLEKFIADFRERFDQQKIPLLAALDPDTGIGYGNLIDDRNGMEMLENIHFPDPKRDPKPLKWTQIHQLILKLWVMNKQRDVYSPLIIKSSDIIELDDVAAGNLPSTIAVMFRIAGDKLLLDSLGGATATSLMGRFSAFSREVSTLCTELATFESAVHPDIIFADIGQLSDAHVDNINRRMQIYAYEIPINVHSDLPPSNQIRPDDLLVSVRGDELILESASLDKRVIPRFSSAYNPTKTDLSIFRLLCDLQHQGLKSGMSFDLERLFPGLNFYPAVEYEEVIISPAKWLFTKQELQSLISCPDGEIQQTVTSFRRQYNLPQRVLLGSFDQQLVFDLDNEQEVKFFVACLKGEKQVTLKEFIDAGGLVHAEGHPLAGQFIAFLKHDGRIYKNLTKELNPLEMAARRNYPPGSTWLYLKLFCTPQTANRLLLSVIQPVLKDHRALFDQWFFIRYIEKGYHLRLRIQGKAGELAKLLPLLTDRLLAAGNGHLIKDYQADTYKREIERYGSDLIDEVEAVFCAGSTLFMTHLERDSRGNPGLTVFELAVLTVFHMVNSGISKADVQISFLHTVTNSFLNEFLADKQLKVDLDKNYREINIDLAALLDGSVWSKHEHSYLLPYFNGFLEKWEALSARTLGQPRQLSLLADLIHMQVNRCFPFEQRKYELIIYYCLHKYMISKKARSKADSVALAS